MRDLKKDFDTSMNNLAEIKSLSIETKNKIVEQTEIAKDYENKALTILQKAQAGELEQVKADRLASEALKKKQNAIENIKKYTLDAKNYDAMSEKLEGKIASIKEQIVNWEDEIKTLKARHKVAITSKKMSQQFLSMSDNNAATLLESMKEKVNKEEAMAQAYDEMNLIETDIDKEINEAVGGTYSSEVQQSLIELKKQISPRYLITQKEIQEKEQ